MSLSDLGLFGFEDTPYPHPYSSPSTYSVSLSDFYMIWICILYYFSNIFYIEMSQYFYAMHFQILGAHMLQDVVVCHCCRLKLAEASFCEHKEDGQAIFAISCPKAAGIYW